jgi:hypothetical protein
MVKLLVIGLKDTSDPALAGRSDIGNRSGGGQFVDKIRSELSLRLNSG